MAETVIKQDPTSSFLSTLNKEDLPNSSVEQEEVEVPAQAGQEEEQEEVEQEENQDPSQEEEEQQYFESELFDTEPEEDTTVIATPQAVVKEKVKLDLKDYISSNKDKFDNYFKYSGMDVESLGTEDLLRFKLAQENPTWDKEDIDFSLRRKYGIGLKLKEIPEDAYDDEKEKLERENEHIKLQIREGQLQAKTDVIGAKRTLEEIKANLDFPDFEADINLNADPTQIIEQYTAEQTKKAQEFRETQWVPNIKEVISKTGGFKHKFEYEVIKGDKVVSELSYKFTEAQKQELEKYLTDYQPHPSDDKYVIDQEQGTIDYQRFVKDKAEQLFVKDIIKSSLKDIVAQYTAKFIKEEMVNYQDTPKTIRKDASTGADPYAEIFARGAQHHRGY